MGRQGEGIEVEVAVTAENPNFAGCGGSRSRETVVVVEAMKVSHRVNEAVRSLWCRSLEQQEQQSREGMGHGGSQDYSSQETSSGR